MLKNKITNIVICGVGGQGVLKASELCAWAANYAGFHVKKSEVHGMAQRGGSVESHLRFGKEVFSPLVPAKQIDFLVPLDANEAKRFQHDLSNKGISLTRYISQCRDIINNNKKGLNICMLAVLSYYLPFTISCWLKAIEKVFPRYIEENKNLFLKTKKIINPK